MNTNWSIWGIILLIYLRDNSFHKIVGIISATLGTHFYHVNPSYLFLIQLKNSYHVSPLSFPDSTQKPLSCQLQHGPINHGWATAFEGYRVTLNARETRDYLRDLIIWAQPPLCFTVFQSIKMTILFTGTISQ